MSNKLRANNQLAYGNHRVFASVLPDSGLGCALLLS